MAKNKKPTMNQVRSAINNLGQWVQNIEKVVTRLDYLVSLYIKYNKDDKKFADFIDKTAEEYNEQQLTKEQEEQELQEKQDVETK